MTRFVKKADIVHECVDDWKAARPKFKERVAAVGKEIEKSQFVDKSGSGREDFEDEFEADMGMMFRVVGGHVVACENTASKLFGTMETDALEVEMYRENKADFKDLIDQYERFARTGKWK